MNMDIVLLIIAICYPFIFKYLEQYFVQKGKNAAQKEDMRDIQYETNVLYVKKLSPLGWLN